MSDVTHGKGGVVTVTDTAQLIEIVPAPGVNTLQKSAMTLKVSNEGSSTIYAIVNAETSDYTEADAIPIGADKDFWFVGQPVKKLVLACASGESSTANYGAY
jgi:hypothetical protein